MRARKQKDAPAVTFSQTLRPSSAPMGAGRRSERLVTCNGGRAVKRYLGTTATETTDVRRTVPPAVGAVRLAPARPAQDPTVNTRAYADGVCSIRTLGPGSSWLCA